MKFIFASILTFVCISNCFTAEALSFDFKETFEAFQDGIEEQSSASPDGEVLVLPTYQEDLLAGQTDGTIGIVGAISVFLDFFKLIVGPLLVLFAVVNGVKMVTAGSESEDVYTKSKNFVTYSIQGLLVILVSDALVEVFFGPFGEVFRGGEAGAQDYAREVGRLFQGMYSLVQVLISVFAVLMIVMAGMRYVAGSYDDEQIAVAKRQIQWSLVGLFVVGISEFVAKNILFKDQGRSVGVNEAELLFAQVTNFIVGTLGTVAFIAMIYAGALYVTARGEEDNVAKAKKIMRGAVLGLILAAGAFALTNTLVALDAGR